MSIKVIVFILAISFVAGDVVFKISEIEDGFFAELKKDKHADKDRGEDSYMTTPQSLILGDGIGSCEFSSKFISQMLVSSVAKFMLVQGPSLSAKRITRENFRKEILGVVHAEIKKFADLFMTSYYLEIDAYKGGKEIVNEEILPTSTTMIVSFLQNGVKPILTVFQKGDSGIAVFRRHFSADGAGYYYKLHFLSSEQQTKFNRPHQFVSEPDHLVNSQLDAVYNVGIQENDIVITGSDGLFDNMPVAVLNFFVNYLVKLYITRDYRSAIRKDVFGQFVAILYDKFKQSKDKIEKQINFHLMRLNAKRAAKLAQKDDQKEVNPTVNGDKKDPNPTLNGDAPTQKPGNNNVAHDRGSRPSDFDALYQDPVEAAKRKQDLLEKAKMYENRAQLIRKGSTDTADMINKVIQGAGERFDPVKEDSEMGQFRKKMLQNNQKMVYRVEVNAQKDKIELIEGRADPERKKNLMNMDASVSDLGKELNDIKNRLNKPNPFAHGQNKGLNVVQANPKGPMKVQHDPEIDRIPREAANPYYQPSTQANRLQKYIPQKITPGKNLMIQGIAATIQQNQGKDNKFYIQRRLMRNNYEGPSIQPLRDPNHRWYNPPGQNMGPAPLAGDFQRQTEYDFKFQPKRITPNNNQGQAPNPNLGKAPNLNQGQGQKINQGTAANLNAPGDPKVQDFKSKNLAAPPLVDIKEEVTQKQAIRPIIPGSDQIRSDDVSFQKLIEKFMQLSSNSILGLTMTPNSNKLEKDPSVTDQDIDAFVNEFLRNNFAFSDHEMNTFKTRFKSKEFSTPIALAAKRIAVQDEYFPSVFYIRSRFESEKEFPPKAKDDDISVASGLVVNANFDRPEFDYIAEMEMVNYIRKDLITSLPKAVGSFVTWLMGEAGISKSEDGPNSPQRDKLTRQITEKLKAF